MRQPPYKNNMFLWTLLVLCMAIPAKATVTEVSTLKKNPVHISFPGLQLAAADSSSFIIPFSRSGNLLLIKARADDQEGNFILDTGCPGLVLNITYFRNYPVTADPESESRGMAGAEAAEHIEVKNFRMGGIQEHRLKAQLANLGNIENSKGVKVLGLVGMQFLTNCELIIDFQKNLMYFHVMGRKGLIYKNALLKDTAAYHTLPFEITDNRMIVKTTMAGKKLRFVIDCAAETNILDSRLPNKIFETLSITGRVSLVGVGNKKVEAVTGSLASFNIGNQNIKDMPVLVTNLEKTCFAYGGCVDGVLGLDNLSLQRIGFNFTTLKMYIWK